MANLHRGEIEAQFGGRVYRLCLTLGALAELENAFGADDLVALAARIEKGRLRARDLVTIISCGLRGAGATLSDGEVAALTPYAPARLRAVRGTSGVTFSLLRRARRDGDGWQLIDIPLGEEIEAYELDLLRNGSLVRTLTMTGASVLYAAAQETLDFGAAQSGFDIQVFQMSAAVGRGFPFTARVLV